MKYGIQGGKGSFNEEAARHYFNQNNLSGYELEYLFTTENVLQALNKGQITLGQFAVFNSLGGMVTESIYAMAKHKFEIIDEFAIKIRHFLMTKPDVSFDNIETIWAHPQVLKQCRQSLKTKYPALIQVSGEGNLIDTAQAAKALFEGSLSESTAILGPHALAGLYGFSVVDKDLQDDRENFTSFLVVKSFTK